MLHIWHARNLFQKLTRTRKNGHGNPSSILRVWVIFLQTALFREYCEKVWHVPVAED